MYVEPSVWQGMQQQQQQESGQDAATGGIHSRASASYGKLCSWETESVCEAHHIPCEVASVLDFAVTVGGDGTVLWTCHLFGNRSMPPLVPLHMGSLGFLCPFHTDDMEVVLGDAVKGGKDT